MGKTIGKGGFAKVRCKDRYYSEGKHDVTNVGVAVKVINKVLMKNKNMISKVNIGLLRSSDKLKYLSSFPIPMLLNSMRYSIQQMIFLLLWKWPKEDNSMSISKSMTSLNKT